MSVFSYVRICVWAYLRMCVFPFVRICVLRISVLRICVCAYFRMCVCTHVRICVCLKGRQVCQPRFIVTSSAANANANVLPWSSCRSIQHTATVTSRQLHCPVNWWRYANRPSVVTTHTVAVPHMQFHRTQQNANSFTFHPIIITVTVLIKYKISTDTTLLQLWNEQHVSASSAIFRLHTQLWYVLYIGVP